MRMLCYDIIADDDENASRSTFSSPPSQLFPLYFFVKWNCLVRNKKILHDDSRITFSSLLIPPASYHITKLGIFACHVIFLTIYDFFLISFQNLVITISLSVLNIPREGVCEYLKSFFSDIIFSAKTWRRREKLGKILQIIITAKEESLSGTSHHHQGRAQVHPSLSHLNICTQASYSDMWGKKNGLLHKKSVIIFFFKKVFLEMIGVRARLR